MDLHKKNYFKIIISIGFLLSTLLLCYVRSTTYISTDLSFYDNLRFIPFFMVFIGILILCLNTYDTLLKKSSLLYIVCIFYLSFCIVIISQLWVIKFGASPEIDSWIHLGHIEESINLSKLNVKTNFYPLLILLLSEISIITKISPQIAYTYFPFVLVFCYTLILLSLIKVYSYQFKETLPIGTVFLIILINPIILVYSILVPWTLNFVFILLYIYLLEKYFINNSMEFIILLILCLFSLTTTHILGVVFVFVATIFMYMCSQLLNIYSKKSEKRRILKNINYSLLILIIILCWIFMITGFYDNQFYLLLQKIPDILYGTPTVQQSISTSKSFSHFLLSWLNTISNMFLILLSIIYIIYEIFNENKHAYSNSFFESKYYIVNFVLSGFILFVSLRYLMGKTEYSGISMRFLSYTAIVYPVLIYYLSLKFSRRVNINIITIILLLIFVGSTLTMYSRPGYENSSPIITNSLYQGIDWGNDKITFNENTKLITAGDYVYQYLYYRIGYKKCNEILKGSNKGLLTYFNYDSNLYKYRQESSSFFIKKDDNVYFYYYSLMKYKTAYAKYESKNLGINEESLKNKKNNKIYDSTGFVVFNLNELEIDILAKSVEQQNVKL